LKKIIKFPRKTYTGDFSLTQMCQISREKSKYIERNLATFLQILAILENPKIHFNHQKFAISYQKI
jgi:hypothetical protein